MSRTSAFIAGSMVTVILGAGTAYAATGGNLILGKRNAASKTTSLASNASPVLSLSAPGPALAVNNPALITNLNADMVDGVDGSALLTWSEFTTEYYWASGAISDADQDGTVDNIFARVSCPAGTTRTGGGFADYTVTGLTYDNSPTDDNGWFGATLIEEGYFENVRDFSVYAICAGPAASQMRAAARRSVTDADDISSAQQARLSRAVARSER